MSAATGGADTRAMLALALLVASSCHFGDAETCTRRCDGGDLRACTVLGSMYVEAVGVDRDSRRGDALFVTSCKRGDAEACNEHGVRVREHVLDGKLASWAPALDAFERACRGGSARGCNNAAEALVDERVPGRAKEGVALYRKSCELEADGSAGGCLAYGQALRRGKLVDKDDVLAAKWLGRACRLGAVDGCAMAQELGENVRLSAEASARLVRARCDAGDPKACARVGADLLEKAPRDAVEPLSLACLGDEASACTALGRALLRGTGGLAVDVDRATKSLDKACGLDDAFACRLLADETLVGHAVPRDEGRAVSLYKKACALGNDVACRHESGVALAKTLKRKGDAVAETVLTKDCRAGDREACASLTGLGNPAAVVAAKDARFLPADDGERACARGAGHACLVSGLKVARRDAARARALFDMGCSAGYPRACAEAGALFLAGKGGGVDADAAVDAFARGCTLGNVAACAGAAKAARKLGGDAVARARPALEQACTLKVGGACAAASRLE